MKLADLLWPFAAIAAAFVFANYIGTQVVELLGRMF